jgi:L-rhamnose mutarotase
MKKLFAAHRMSDEVPNVQRVCFVLKVRPNRLEDYRIRHRTVWPAMTSALSSAGWRNYTLFLRPDGLLVGYLHCDDFEKAKSSMKSLDVNTLWQQEMSSFFEDLEGDLEDQMQPLEEIFHLD